MSLRLVLYTCVALMLTGAAVADVPQLINYQSVLLDDTGKPVKIPVSVIFAIWDAEIDGDSLWSEQRTVDPDVQGAFSIQLGEIAPIGSAVFAGPDRWLSIKVETDPEMTPRARLASVPFAFSCADDGGSHWTVVDSVLYTNNYLGIARGGIAGNVLYGDSAHTMVNLGVQSVTGTDGQNYFSATVGGGRYNTAGHSYSTIAGGYADTASGGYSAVGGGVANTASSNYSTVGGGVNNTASGNSSTVAGGSSNTTSGNSSTVAGGSSNTASGDYSAVAGGSSNMASGNHSVIAGGISNTASGVYSAIAGGYGNTTEGSMSFAAGLQAKANHSGTFIWADYTVADFASTSNNQFLIRASGGVGIGKNDPAEQLDVNGTVKMTGFDLPTGAASGSVLTSDANGVGTWQASPEEHWTVTDSVLYTKNYLGIARGGTAGNVMYGDSLHTMVNLGVACTTGQNGINNIVYSTVGGGKGNTARQGHTTVAGGRENIANLNYSTVGGGNHNTADEYFSTVAGGDHNTAIDDYSTVSGGYYNAATGQSSTVAGGLNNTASGRGSIVAGGGINAASGWYSFAAGARAKANHEGAFVWADRSSSDFVSTALNEFSARATGGVRLVTAVDGSGTPTAGVQVAAGGSSWSSISDRNAKENFDPVDARDVLEKVAAFPISTWNYKTQAEAIRHMGPMAQDLYAAFGLGEDEKRINTIDADGVALAAIQGLYLQNQEQQKQIAELMTLVKQLLAEKE